jgi:hypothetical protein
MAINRSTYGGGTSASPGPMGLLDVSDDNNHYASGDARKSNRKSYDDDEDDFEDNLNEEDG